MPFIRWTASIAPLLTLALLGAAQHTPVEKVVSLLEDLKFQVEFEGKAEAEAYERFACDCKTATSSKSRSIQSKTDTINALSATIEKKTAERTEMQSELKERKARHVQVTKDLQEENSVWATDLEDYTRMADDLSKAIQSLVEAQNALEGTKSSSFMEVEHKVNKALRLANDLHLSSTSDHGSASQLLQRAAVDPNDPTYKYHSQGIIDTIADLLEKFRAKKTELDDEHDKAKNAHEKKVQACEDEITENNNAMDALETSDLDHKQLISTRRNNLHFTAESLKDDQLFLTDLTHMCEVRAKDWDQRSQLRSGELTALEKALEILTTKVSEADSAAGARVLLQRSRWLAADDLGTIRKHSGGKGDTITSVPSFLQDAIALENGRGFLARSTGRSSLQSRQERALDLLRKESRRLDSTSLASLADRVAADPFAKVKTLIQKLIERLLAESRAEATKKGFCDEQLGKARHDRDSRLSDVRALLVDIGSLEVTTDELDASLNELRPAIEDLETELSTERDFRSSDKKANLATIRNATMGRDAVKEATSVLRTFYTKAGRATVLAQFSPVQEFTDGPGFEGAYQGKQAESEGIFGLLEVIVTDFERTIRVTEEAEAAAHAAFVEFERASLLDISGKKKNVELDEQELERAGIKTKQKMEDLQNNQDLLDDALKTVEELKPQCIDNTMSYEDRVAKREEEIEALKNALTILGEP